MKQLTVLFALLLGISLSAVQAQNCQKSASSCCKKSASVAKAEQPSGTVEAAAKLASLDETIESRTCEKSGSVSYVRKVVNNDSGDVTFADVEYDNEKGQFVNVAPAAKSCGTKSAGAGCCDSKKSATAQGNEESKENIKATETATKSTVPAATQAKAQMGS
jgi:hypothetical protein